MPPRESGDTVDFKNLSSGSRMYFPVFTPGAMLSVGDLQSPGGEGEAIWNAVKKDGVTCLRAGLIEEGATKYNVVQSDVATRPDIAPVWEPVSDFCRIQPPG